MNDLCGVRLSTVGVVVGWFTLISAIFTSILICVAFAQLDDIVKMLEDQMNDPNNDINIRTTVIVALSIYLTIGIAAVLSSALLIVGTVKERHLLLTPWLVNAYILIFCSVLNYIYMIYVAIAGSVPFGSFFVAIILGGIYLVIQITIWNAIHSLFKQIRANRDLQQRLLPASGPPQNNYTKMYPTVE